MHRTNIASPTMLWASHHCTYGEVRTGSSVPMITTAVWFSISRGVRVGDVICRKILSRLGLHARSERRRETEAQCLNVQLSLWVQKLKEIELNRKCKTHRHALHFYMPSIHACGIKMCVSTGHEVHECIVKITLKPNPINSNAVLVDMLHIWWSIAWAAWLWQKS